MFTSALRMSGIALLGGLAVYAGYSALNSRDNAAERPLALATATATDSFETEATSQIRGMPEKGDEESENGMTANPVVPDKKDEGGFTTNPVVADKKDEGGFTTNPVVADKKDSGGFTTNPQLVAKKDDGDFFTENDAATAFDPCLKADGTPYQGPGTALNPFAPINPCLPKATAESFAEFIAPTPLPEVNNFGLPRQPDYFAPEPPLPGFGSDYRAL